MLDANTVEVDDFLPGTRYIIIMNQAFNFMYNPKVKHIYGVAGSFLGLGVGAATSKSVHGVKCISHIIGLSK